MVILVLGREPVERVADAIFPIGMSTEIDDFVECLIHNGKSPQPASPFAPTFQFLGSHSRCSAPYGVIDTFLPPLIASIEPDRITPARFDHFRNGVENRLGFGIVVHNSDREDEVKRRRVEWQFF